MRKLLFAAVAGASLLVALMTGSLAIAKHGNGSSNARAHLTGYEETPNTLSSPARGDFRAKINKRANTIDYRLTYSGFVGGTVTQAHIHFGQRAMSGGISAWLCGTGTTPPTTCPPTGGTVTGTIEASDVIGPATQGIAPTEMAELIQAMRAGYTYANVHSTTYPGGEIRGQIKAGGGRDD